MEGPWHSLVQSPGDWLVHFPPARRIHAPLSKDASLTFLEAVAAAALAIHHLGGFGFLALGLHPPRNNWTSIPPSTPTSSCRNHRSQGLVLEQTGEHEF